MSVEDLELGVFLRDGGVEVEEFSLGVLLDLFH